MYGDVQVSFIHCRQPQVALPPGKGYNICRIGGWVTPEQAWMWL